MAFDALDITLIAMIFRRFFIISYAVIFADAAAYATPCCAGCRMPAIISDAADAI